MRNSTIIRSMIAEVIIVFIQLIVKFRCFPSK